MQKGLAGSSTCKDLSADSRIFNFLKRILATFNQFFLAASSRSRSIRSRGSAAAAACCCCDQVETLSHYKGLSLDIGRKYFFPTPLLH